MKKMIRLVAIPVLVVSVVICFLSALSTMNTDQQLEEKEQLERALKRACVACYAVDGAYPPTLDYLCEHYGIQINDSLFTVKYEVFASNLMPDITVLVN